jgi:hypothetical protein
LVAGYAFSTLYFGSPIESIQLAFNSLLKDAPALLSSVLPVVAVIVEGLKTAATESLDMAIKAVNFADLTGKVYPPMTTMA